MGPGLEVLPVIYRIVFAAAGLSVVLLHALIDNNVVHWSPWIVVAVATAVGALAFLDNIRVIFYKYQAYQREKARSEMHKPLIAALNSITEARETPLEVLGISVFAVRRGWDLRWWVVPWWAKLLKQIFRFRLSDYPPDAAVRWTKGKGAIGACWESGVPVLHDRRDAAARYGEKGRRPDKKSYRQLPEEVRSRFTHHEFIQTIDNWGEILAMPIKSEKTGRLVGVLSIDCLMRYYTRPDMTVLAGEDIKVFAGLAASVVQGDVPRF